MSKSTIRAYTAWWPEEDITTRQEAQDQCVTELWTAEYMKGEGFDDSDIEIVENLQPGESHRIHVPSCRLGEGFDVVVEYEGETYEDTSYQFQTERECHHLDWYEVSGRGDYYDDRY
tara:strand:- start:28 stop:378 length:351 start_codon:yes stop_codon:yes gene_type:complete